VNFSSPSTLSLLVLVTRKPPESALLSPPPPPHPLIQRRWRFSSRTPGNLQQSDSPSDLCAQRHLWSKDAGGQPRESVKNPRTFPADAIGRKREKRKIVWERDAIYSCLCPACFAGRHFSFIFYGKCNDAGNVKTGYFTCPGLAADPCRAGCESNHRPCRGLAPSPGFPGFIYSYLLHGKIKKKHRCRCRLQNGENEKKSGILKNYKGSCVAFIHQFPLWLHYLKDSVRCRSCVYIRESWESNNIDRAFKTIFSSQQLRPFVFASLSAIVELMSLARIPSLHAWCDMFLIFMSVVLTLSAVHFFTQAWLPTKRMDRLPLTSQSQCLRLLTIQHSENTIRFTYCAG
jgi:hypothetical protein